MKRTIFTILLFCAFPVASFAQRGILVGLPHDDPNARREVYHRLELEPLVTDYNQIIRTRVAALKAEDLAKVFGPKLEQRRLLVRNGDPTNSVAPLFAPYSLSFSGLLNIGDKSHRDLYAIGNIGYVEFFYELDGTLKTALLYVRLDDKFVPLRSTNDFSRRLEWDKAKFNALKQWLGMNSVPIEGAKAFSPNAAKDSNGLVMVCIPGTNGWMEEVKPWPLLTNRFFVNCDASWTSQGPDGIWVKPEKIQEAQQARECQPAEEDPGGNRGITNGGYLLSLRMEKRTFAPGEAINAAVIFRNVGDRKLWAPSEIPRFDTEFVLTNEKGEPVRSVEEEGLDGLSPFQKSLRTMVRNPKFSEIEPKTQVKKQARIDQLFRLSAPQGYHVQVRYLTRAGRTDVITVSSGTVVFKTVEK